MTYDRKETVGENVLYCGNSLKVLPSLGEKFADHTITDPPYEDALHEAFVDDKFQRSDGGNAGKSLGFEGISAIRFPVMEMIANASRGWALMFNIAEGAGEWEKAIKAAGAKYDTWCFWRKPDGLPRMNGQGPARPGEGFSTAWCGKGFRSWNSGGKRGFYDHPVNPPDRQKVAGENGKLVAAHPTEKPLSLMREMILDFTQPGDVILDPFAGIFSTGVACIQTGRRFIGIELNPAYFEIGLRRMREAEAKVKDQPVLFNAPQKSRQTDFGFKEGE